MTTDHSITLPPLSTVCPDCGGNGCPVEWRDRDTCHERDLCYECGGAGHIPTDAGLDILLFLADQLTVHADARGIRLHLRNYDLIRQHRLKVQPDPVSVQNTRVEE